MSELKILAGKAKGRKIKSCKGLHVRPMLSRVKKSLFDIIHERLMGSICLDLFSGTGSIGLEAISRGVKQVTFVERNSVSIKTINYNIDLLAFKEQSELIIGDVFIVIKRIQEKFDIVFVDPPFPDIVVENILKAISDSDVLKNEGILIIHHPTYKQSVETAGKLRCIRKATYGQNVLSFYTNIS